MISMGLRSDYLQDLTEVYVKNFRNVLPCDYFKNVNVKPNESYICNLSDSKSRGSHFVAIRIKNDEVIYFDSYGLHCSNEDILEKISQIGFAQITYCTKCIQSLFSKFCGFFCLAFLLHTENHSVEDFFNLFDMNNLENKNQLYTYIFTIKKQFRELIHTDFKS